jgi:hypothetical protein
MRGFSALGGSCAGSKSGRVLTKAQTRVQASKFAEIRSTRFGFANSGARLATLMREHVGRLLIEPLDVPVSDEVPASQQVVHRALPAEVGV